MWQEVAVKFRCNFVDVAEAVKQPFPDKRSQSQEIMRDTNLFNHIAFDITPWPTVRIPCQNG